jgi:hypothetical protein
MVCNYVFNICIVILHLQNGIYFYQAEKISKVPGSFNGRCAKPKQTIFAELLLLAFALALAGLGLQGCLSNCRMSVAAFVNLAFAGRSVQAVPLKPMS